MSLNRSGSDFVTIDCPTCGEEFKARLIEHLINGMKREAHVVVKPDLTAFWMHSQTHMPKMEERHCKKHKLKYAGVFSPEVVPKIYHTWECQFCTFRDFQNIEEFRRLWTVGG